MQITRDPADYRISVHHLGFRPFFLLAGVFGVISVALWFWLYKAGAATLPNNALPVVLWHAHEMIYGYAIAVIAGFLLTAARNWTGVQTLHGSALIMLALLWVLARALPFVPNPAAFAAMAIVDLSFNLLLCLAILHPIFKAKQWAQLAVWSKLVVLLAGNVFFYLGLFGTMEDGIRLGLYTGLYIVISLILMMGRRVIPFFIEKGVDYDVVLTNRRWVDISSLVLMLMFLVLEVFVPLPEYAALAAGLLFFLHGFRLIGWYTRGIWTKPLLWSLYIGYAWIVLGFGMLALSRVTDLNPALAVHAFAYGGIGMMTIGMMTRVALGHTGRNVFSPPPVLKWMFLLVLVGSVVRIVLPIFFPGFYANWIITSQFFWVAAFAIFVWVYTPMLILPRIDGQYG